jgi:ribosomal protein L30E
MPKKSEKKIISGGIAAEIKEAIKEKKLVIGTRVVLKGLKKGEMRRITYASNCPEDGKNEIERYSKGGVEVGPFGKNSVELGETCGKSFKAVVVGIKK